MDFLTDMNMGKAPKIGKKVVVIGGGNVAIDAAMTQSGRALKILL